MCPDMSPTFIGIVPCTKYIPTKVLISKAHSKMHPRSPWEALFWMCLQTTSATGLYSLTSMRWDDTARWRELQHHRWRNSCAWKLHAQTCPSPVAERCGDGMWMGKSWSRYREDYSHLEAAACSQVKNFAGLGFGVTLRSIIPMRIDKP